jgi:hypothetical protein
MFFRLRVRGLSRADTFLRGEIAALPTVATTPLLRRPVASADDSLEEGLDGLFLLGLEPSTLPSGV